MRALQNDNFNLSAAETLPLILPQVNSNLLSQEQKKAFTALKSWKFNNDITEIGPTIFTEWNRQFMDAVWDDEFNLGSNTPTRTPTLDRTLALMQHDPESPWFDNGIRLLGNA